MLGYSGVFEIVWLIGSDQGTDSKTKLCGNDGECFYKLLLKVIVTGIKSVHTGMVRSNIHFLPIWFFFVQLPVFVNDGIIADYRTDIADQYAKLKLGDAYHRSATVTMHGNRPIPCVYMIPYPMDVSCSYHQCQWQAPKLRALCTFEDFWRLLSQI